MLARWSRNAARLLDVSLESTGSLSLEDDELLGSLETIRTIVMPLPDLAWGGVARIRGWNVSPMYKSIQTILSEDVSHLARLLSELEPLPEEDYEVETPVDRNALAYLPLSDEILEPLESNPVDFPDGASPYIPPRRKRRKSTSDQQVLISGTFPSIPAIVVTPCAHQPRVTSCRVPVQDSAFGRRLTLPSHPVINHMYPPHFPLFANPALSHIDRWRYNGGHWHAILPSLEEQERRGAFSRPFAARKRPCQIPYRRANR